MNARERRGAIRAFSRLPISLLRSGRGGKLRGLSNGSSRASSPPHRFAFRILGAIAWLGLAVLGLLVKVALIARLRSPGTMAVIWGLVFAFYVWWGSKQIGIDQNRALLLALVTGVASAFFVYMRGAGLEKPPAEQPGVFVGRAAAKKQRQADLL